MSLTDKGRVDLLKLGEAEDDLRNTSEAGVSNGTRPSARENGSYLATVAATVVRLARVALEVDRLELRLLFEMRERAQVGDLVATRLVEREREGRPQKTSALGWLKRPCQSGSAHPELFELVQALEAFNLLDPVVADVEHAQPLVGRETLNLADAIVRDVELLEALELFEAGEDGDPIRLDRENLELLEGREVL